MTATSPRSARADACITLRSLGEAAVVLRTPDGSESTLLRLGKPFAVLAYLALAPGRTASRERLADLLWGDQDPQVARPSLRRALSELRRHLGNDIVDSNEYTCTLSTDLKLDVDEFLVASDGGCFRTALDLYRGEFLRDFASPGCRQFEEWADVERAHLRSRALRAAELLCRSALDNGTLSEARYAAARAREIDPHGELGWRLTLETLIAGGDRVAALGEATKCRAWLEAEDREPEPATLSLLRTAERKVDSTGASGNERPSLVADLIAREKEFAAILDAWNRAAAGRATMVAIHAPAGLGKTRLLEAIAHRLRSMRRGVVFVRAYPGERMLPFAFAGALVRALVAKPGAAGISLASASHLVALDSEAATRFPAVRAAQEGASFETLRASALRDLIAAIADEAPLALLIDDAHWIDEASRHLLSGALARLDAEKVLVAITSRQTAIDLDLGDRAQSLALNPLTITEIGALVESIASIPVGQEWPKFLVARISAASRGIPLLVISALQQLTEEGLLVCHDTWFAPDVGALRERLRRIDAVAVRLRALSANAFRVLLAIAIAGRPLPLPLAHALARSRDDGDSAALDELERMGQLKRTGAQVDVAHDFIGETAIEIADPDLRRAAEHDLGTALVAAEDLQWVERGARHLAAAGAPAEIAEPVTRVMQSIPRRLRRHPRDVVAKIVTRPREDPLVATVLRALPASQRFPYRWTVAAFSLLVLAAGSAALLLARLDGRQPAPSIRLSIGGMDSVSSTTIPLNRRNWAANVPLVASFGRPRMDVVAGPNRGALMMPGGGAWAAEHEFPDSGGTDVVLLKPNGSMTRLTASRADETPVGWSPDGRQLLIYSSAFSSNKTKALAILDISSRQIRPIGPLNALEGSAAWSPDGTRIAFVSGDIGGDTDQLCIIDVDGARSACHHLQSRPVTLLGWSSESTLLLLMGLSRTVTAFDVSAASENATSITHAEPDLSPDGEWLVFKRTGSGGDELGVAIAQDPNQIRLIAPSAPISNAIWSWTGTFERRDYLDTIAITAYGDTLPLGEPYLLQASGKSSRGLAMPVRRQLWRSLTPTIALVDSTGLVTGLREGTARIELSAGGWRRAVRAFVIRKGASGTLATLDWHDGFGSDWVRFGHPYPRIVDDSLLGRAFLNNGDGYYFSGAYLLRAFDGKHGLVLDATISTPITLPREQLVQVGLVGIRAPAELRASWNHLSGYLPSRFIDPLRSCFMGYPAREGPGREFSTTIGDLPRPANGALPPLATGRPTHLRVQIFPDGRCGVSLEGLPPWIFPKPLGRLDSLFVLIQGNSVRTRLLVGAITIRSGVPEGVDWSSTDGRR